MPDTTASPILPRRRSPGIFRAFARSYAFFRASRGQEAWEIARQMTGQSFQVPGGDVVNLSSTRAIRIANDAVRITGERFGNFFNRGDDNRLTRAEHVRAETSGKFASTYRYTLTLEFESNNGDRVGATWIADSNKNLSAAELRAWAESQLPEPTATDHYKSPFQQFEDERWRIRQIDLVLAERRT